jgi:RNA recognition motif-containing protein
METLSDTKLDDLRRKLGSAATNELYVGNLPYHFESHEVKSLFRDCGEINSIELKKGFAFVKMVDSKGARRVLNYDGHKVMGRPLKISYKSTQQ